MSAICAIINFDGQPVDPDRLQRMAEAASIRGPDGVRIAVSENAGFVHLAQHTTAESVRERQPISGGGGQLTLVADARIDNRSDLIRELTAAGLLTEKEPTDADLILKAYQRWGEACPQHLIGDFAFAIWDSREKKLFATRDAVGMRQLFYTRQKNRIIIATTLESIVAGLGSEPAPELNKLLVVDILCNHFDRWVHETVYSDVLRIPASHYLLMYQGSHKIIRYWTFGRTPPPTYSSDNDYVEHFRDLFETAVECRLRSAFPVGIAVSGGLDSSSVACVAHHLVGKGAQVQRNIRLYSTTFSKYSNADERRYWEAVRAKCAGFPGSSVAGDDLWGFKSVGCPGRRRTDEPDFFPLPSMWIEMLKLAERDGCRVFLAGEGGDQVLSSIPYYYPEFIIDVGVRRLVTESRFFWRKSGWRMARPVARSLARSVVAGTPMRRFLRKRSKLRATKAPAWVDRTWIQRSNARPPQFRTDDGQWLGSRAAAFAFRQVTSGWDAVGILSYLNSMGASAGAEFGLPFYDRRVIDFLLTIPARLRFAQGRDKLILRLAMNGILAEDVRLRSDRGALKDVVSKGLRVPERGKCEFLLERAGQTLGSFLDINIFRSAWAEFYRGTMEWNWTLCGPLMLEAWLTPLPSCQQASQEITI
jgi:asparagine synthase (glutamine-hydrolysing)